MSKVTVVTACTGTRSVLRTVESVCNQTESDFTHLLVVDGPDYAREFNLNIRPYLPDDGRIKIMELPWNTGHDGYFCYRIYALCGLIIDTPWIAFLDQDCYWTSNHLDTLLVLAGAENLEWAYSLRRVVDLASGEEVDDNCESLGPEVSWQYQKMAESGESEVSRPWSNLVDMNSYLISRNLITAAGANMIQHGLPPERRKAGDRILLDALRKTGAPYACTGQHTAIWPVNGGDENRDLQDESAVWGGNRDQKLDFFRHGNAFMNNKYGLKFPWKLGKVFRQ